MLRLRLRRRPVSDRPPSVPLRWMTVRAVGSTIFYAVGLLVLAAGVWRLAILLRDHQYDGSLGATASSWAYLGELVCAFAAFCLLVAAAILAATTGWWRDRRQRLVWRRVIDRTYHRDCAEQRQLGSARHAVSVETEHGRVTIRLVREQPRRWWRASFTAVKSRNFAGTDVADAAACLEDFRSEATHLDAISLVLRRQELERTRQLNLTREAAAQERRRAETLRQEQQKAQERELAQELESKKRVERIEAEGLARALRSRRK
jgi:hypothetical protein